MRKHKQRPFGLAYHCVIVLTQRSRNFLLWAIGTFNTFVWFYEKKTGTSTPLGGRFLKGSLKMGA